MEAAVRAGVGGTKGADLQAVRRSRWPVAAKSSQASDRSL